MIGLVERALVCMVKEVQSVNRHEDNTSLCLAPSMCLVQTCIITIFWCFSAIIKKLLSKDHPLVLRGAYSDFQVATEMTDCNQVCDLANGDKLSF